MKEVKLQSGRKLEIGEASFHEAKALYVAITLEMQRQHLNGKEDIDANFIKNMVCVQIASEAIDAALLPCLKRCLYEGQKIDVSKTFDPVDAREDYWEICAEVTKEVIAPFTKNLSARFKDTLNALARFQGLS